MDKVIQSSKNITPFGGLNFVFDAIKRASIDSFINQRLGYRSYQATYSYSDILLSLFGNAICNGDYISDIEYLKAQYTEQIFTKIPSPDTVEYVCQELKTPTIEQITENEIVHQLNFNSQFNDLLVALCVKTSQLNNEGNYTLDFDNVVLENQKQDARKSYKSTKGYHPNFAFIGRLPVHIENHNGNTPARYGQKETLERCFNNLNNNGIKITNFRADSASYQKQVIDLVEKQTDFFFIRNINSPNFERQCGKIQSWHQIEINYEKKEVATLIYAPFDGKKTYRIVVTRSLKKDQQINLFSGTAYNYYGIITNNLILTDQQVIEFYNKRGDGENSNKVLISDFNLKHLPFMDLDTNTVFMYLMAMCSILFEWTKIILVKNETQNITLKLRVKAICFRYITTAATLVRHARKVVLKIYSTRGYKILRI